MDGMKDWWNHMCGCGCVGVHLCVLLPFSMEDTELGAASAAMRSSAGSCCTMWQRRRSRKRGQKHSLGKSCQAEVLERRVPGSQKNPRAERPHINGREPSPILEFMFTFFTIGFQGDRRTTSGRSMPDGAVFNSGNTSVLSGADDVEGGGAKGRRDAVRTDSHRDAEHISSIISTNTNRRWWRRAALDYQGPWGAALSSRHVRVLHAYANCTVLVLLCCVSLSCLP